MRYKDQFYPIALSHPFKVNAVSVTPTAVPPPPEPTPDNGVGGCNSPLSAADGSALDVAWPMLGLFGVGLTFLPHRRRLRDFWRKR